MNIKIINKVDDYICNASNLLNKIM